jgi:hypothetical protein
MDAIDVAARFGLEPCGILYRTATTDDLFVACGRPRGHTGPHWAEASQTDIADLAGIRRVPPRAL